MMKEKRKGWKIESWNEEEKERLISQWMKKGLLLHQGCEEYIRIIVHTEQEHTQTITNTTTLWLARIHIWIWFGGDKEK